MQSRQPHLPHPTSSARDTESKAAATASRSGVPGKGPILPWALQEPLRHSSSTNKTKRGAGRRHVSVHPAASLRNRWQSLTAARTPERTISSTPHPILPGLLFLFGDREQDRGPQRHAKRPSYHGPPADEPGPRMGPAGPLSVATMNYLSTTPEAAIRPHAKNARITTPRRGGKTVGHMVTVADIDRTALHGPATSRPWNEPRTVIAMVRRKMRRSFPSVG